MLSEELVDITTRHQVYLERLKAGEIKRTDQLFARLDRDLREVLFALRVSDFALLTAVEGAALVEDIRKGQIEAYKEHLDALISRLYELHQFERDFELEAIDEVTIPEVKPVLRPQSEEDGGVPLWAEVRNTVTGGTGKALAAFLAAWAAHEVGRGADTVRLAVAEGWTPDRLRTAFTGTRANGNRDGLFYSARRNTRTEIETAVQHVSTATRVGVQKRVQISARRGGAGIIVGRDGIVQSISAAARRAARAIGARVGLRLTLPGYRWVSVLDSATSQICRSLDGRFFQFGKGPLPPRHRRCRSSIIADIPGRFLRNADDTRPAQGADGAQRVNAEQTYYSWLGRQPASFQDDALGVTRAELFRKGGLSAEDFARLNLDRNFEPLTLDEMRKRAPAAFARAGL